MYLLSYIFLTLSVVMLIKNIFDYRANTKYQNSDRMGAMVNWHFGFFISWLFFCLAIFVYPDIEWYYAFIVLLFFIVATYLVWYLVDFIFDKLVIK